MSDVDPIARFRESYERARARESFDVARVALATADARGRPSVRFVLVKQFDARGFEIYTHLESRKGRELRENPFAALAFHWESTGEQVRIEGPVEPIDSAESDAYFAARPRGSQVGAWASQQSATLSSRSVLTAAVAEAEGRYAGGPVPRPPFWGGIRLLPERIEFWQNRDDRLHDRVLYTRADGTWTARLLSP